MQARAWALGVRDGAGRVANVILPYVASAAAATALPGRADAACAEPP